jgi:hypothetical protein
VLELNTAGVGDAYRRFIFAEFFKEAAVTAVCLISNILSLASSYIVLWGRSFPLRRYSALFAVAVLVLATVPAAVLASRRWALQHTDQSTFVDRGFYLGALQTVPAVKAASILFNVVCLVCIGVSGASLASSRKRSIKGEGQRKASLTSELVRRLVVYPVIQIATQLPVLWDYWIYMPRAFDLRLGGSSSSDDSFYKTQDYRACWALQFVLTPSAGVWFAAAFVYLSKDVQKQFLARLVQFCPGIGVCVERNNETSIRRKASSIMSFFGRPSAARTNGNINSNAISTASAPDEPALSAVLTEVAQFRLSIVKLDEQQLCDLIDQSASEEQADGQQEANPGRSSTFLLRPTSVFSPSKGSLAQSRGSVFSISDGFKSGEENEIAAPPASTLNPLAPADRAPLDVIPSARGRISMGTALEGDARARPSETDGDSWRSSGSDADETSETQKLRLHRAFELASPGGGVAVLKAPAALSRGRERSGTASSDN